MLFTALLLHAAKVTTITMLWLVLAIAGVESVSSFHYKQMQDFSLLTGIAVASVFNVSQRSINKKYEHQ
jgi:hypothetical protein